MFPAITKVIMALRPEKKLSELFGRLDTRDKSMVKLNIGGVHYTTYRQNLLRYKGSLFQVLLLEPILMEDRLYIDRNGELFRYVLDFLRGKESYIPATYQERQSLLEEAKFYGLIDMAEKLSNYDTDKYIEVLQRANEKPYLYDNCRLNHAIFGNFLTYDRPGFVTINLNKEATFNILVSEGYRIISYAVERNIRYFLFGRD